VAQIARDHGMRFRIMEAVLEVNELTKARMVEKVRAAFGGFEGRTIGVLGLSFKPETDDIRESPAVTIIDGLLAGGARVRAYDPAAMDGCRALWPAVQFCSNAYEAASGADGVVIVTEWNQFRKLELDRLRELLREPVVVDLRNIYEPAKMLEAGFRYVSVGRLDELPTPIWASQ
jgi:UDPglucose 6-dehydrogenase